MGIMGIFLYAGSVWAATGSSSLFENAYNTLYTTFTQARAVVYITAGFGLVGMAVAFIFGKMPFQWLAMITIALFILAMAEKIVGYTVGAGEKTPTSSFGTEVGVEGFKIKVGGGSSDFKDFSSYNYQDKSSLGL